MGLAQWQGQGDEECSVSSDSVVCPFSMLEHMNLAVQPYAQHSCFQYKEKSTLRNTKGYVTTPGHSEENMVMWQSGVVI